MKRILYGSIFVLGLAFVCSMGGSRLAAQELSKPTLPTVEAILDKEAAAVGGKEANQKVKTAIVKATLTTEGQEMEFAVYHAGAKKQCIQFTVGTFKQEIVVNGDLAWLKCSESGTIMLEGEERASAFGKAAAFADTFQGVGNWRQQFKQVKLIGEEQVEGKPAYKVAVTTQQDEIWLNYYDKKSGLLVRREVTLDGPEGTQTVVISYSDYRNVNGIMHAFTTTATGGDMDMVVTIESMAHNVAIPEELFVLPPGLTN